jgi:hypothetical protein
MAVARCVLVRSSLHAVLLGLAIALCAPRAPVAAADTEKSQKNRQKPLQRCDQLKGEAELECLKKARERVVEARKKREGEAAAGSQDKESGKSEAKAGAKSEAKAGAKSEAKAGTQSEDTKKDRDRKG